MGVGGSDVHKKTAALSLTTRLEGRHFTQGRQSNGCPPCSLSREICGVSALFPSLTGWPLLMTTVQCRPEAFFYSPPCYMEVFIALSPMTTYQWVMLSFSPVSPTCLVIRISGAPLQTFGFSRAGPDQGIRILTLSYLGDVLGITDLNHRG